MKYYSETELKAQVLKAQVAMLQQCAQAQQNQIGSAASGLATHGGLFSNQLCVFKLDGNLIGEGQALIDSASKD